MKNDKNYRATIIYIALLVLLAVILRHPGYAYLNGHPDLGINPGAAWSVSLAAVGIITFFGFMWLGFKQRGPNVVNKESLRLAIAASVVVVDLVLVATVIFPYPAGDYSDLAKDIISQFNWTVGIVAAFYFATSAYAQVHANEKEEETDKQDEDKK